MIRVYQIFENKDDKIKWCILTISEKMFGTENSLCFLNVKTEIFLKQGLWTVHSDAFYKQYLWTGEKALKTSKRNS